MKASGKAIKIGLLNPEGPVINFLSIAFQHKLQSITSTRNLVALVATLQLAKPVYQSSSKYVSTTH